MLTKKAILAALILSGSTSQAYACATCGHMMSKDWQAQGINTQPGFAVDLSYDYVDQTRMRYGAAAADAAVVNNANSANGLVEAETRTRNTIVTLGIEYNAEEWAVALQMPYLDRYHTTYQNGYGAAPNASQSKTLGDSRIIARYSGFSTDGGSGLILGMKLPTGPSNINFAYDLNAGAPTPNPGNNPLDRSLQPGTGSLDLVAGGYTTGQIESLGWFVQSTLQHAISTRGSYRPGDTVALNTGLRWGKFGQQLTPMLQLNYAHRERDTGAAAVPVYSGADVVYLAPGATLRLGGGTTAYAFVQLPVYQFVNGLQLSPTSILSLGIRHAF